MSNKNNTGDEEIELHDVRIQNPSFHPQTKIIHLQNYSKIQKLC